MIKIPTNKVTIHPDFEYCLENPASVNACFTLFLTPFYILDFIKLYLIPLQLWFRGLWAIKYHPF